METCSLCGQELSEPARLLACLHAGCIGCLESSITPSDRNEYCDDGSNGTYVSQQKVTCPRCGLETGLSSDGVRSLPYDPRTSDSFLQRCQLCSLAPTLAFCKCEECELLMCALCAEAHAKFGDAGSHSIQQLQDTRGSLVPREERWCIRHRSEEASYFCWDCRQAVCSECCAGHRLEDVEGAAKVLLDRIAVAGTGARTALQEARQASVAAQSLAISTRERCDAAAKEVEYFIQGYREAVEAHHAALLAQIDQVRISREEGAEECLDRVERWTCTAQHILQFAEYIMNTASPRQTVSVGSWTLERLAEVCSSARSIRQPNLPDWIQFLPEERPPGNHKYILTGIISTQAVCPFHSALESSGGVLNCKQRSKATFALITRDSDNQELSHGGEKIVAEVFYKDASQRSLAVDVSDEGDGTYSISFTPDASGKLLLSVLVRGLHCKGSPYTVMVSSSRQHKGVFHCCAFCSSGGSKQATCACGSKMPGGYRGCGHGHVGHPGRRHWSCCGNVLQNSECGRPLTHQYSI